MARLRAALKDVRSGRDNLLRAFKAFIGAMGTAVIFDGLVHDSVPLVVDAVDALVTGGPLLGGVVLLVKGANALTP
ncbi:MAG: hypothetical protein DWG74_02785 [Chloroflexi bacterium]|nr:hypothetical protein [Chloroflexota bacterium]